MNAGIHYQQLLECRANKQRLLGILIDPDKFDPQYAVDYLSQIPDNTSHILVGGSTVANQQTDLTIKAIREQTSLPVWLFPGDYTQISERADVLMFLSLLSGRNPEYLIGQQVKAAAQLQNTNLEVIPTAYLLLDGGHQSAVQQVTDTHPMPQEEVKAIVDTALAGQLMGAGLVYLEAGSGAVVPVHPKVISQVNKALDIPLIVGGGIRSHKAMDQAYQAGASMVIMGTHFESVSK